MEELLSNSELIMSDDGYYENPSISASWLKIFKDNPRYYHDLKHGKKKILETKAMMFGRMFHTYLLEPELMDKNFIYEKTLADRVEHEEDILATKWKNQLREEFFATPLGATCKEEFKDKELTLRNPLFKKFIQDREEAFGVGASKFRFDKKVWKESFLANNKLAIATNGDYVLLEEMKLSIEETLGKYLEDRFSYKITGKKFMQELCKGKKTEVAFFWEDKSTKIPLKTKLDSVFTLPNFNRPIILEFKTVHTLKKLTHDNNDYDSMVYKDFEYLHYYLQMAFNIEGFKSQYPNHNPLFLWCVVEKKAGRNYSVIFEPNENYRKISLDHFKGDLMELKHAMQTKHFPLFNYSSNQLISPTDNLIMFANSDLPDTNSSEEDFDFFNI